LIDKNSRTKVFGAQATAGNPITHAVRKAGNCSADKPNTIAQVDRDRQPGRRFLRDQDHALQRRIREDVTDDELIDAKAAGRNGR